MLYLFSHALPLPASGKCGYGYKAKFMVWIGASTAIPQEQCPASRQPASYKLQQQEGGTRRRGVFPDSGVANSRFSHSPAFWARALSPSPSLLLPDNGILTLVPLGPSKRWGAISGTTTPSREGCLRFPITTFLQVTLL